MRVIRVHAFGGPEVLRAEEVPVPSPGKEEVLVRVRAAGVNPVETYLRSGTHTGKPPLPWTPGSDGAGVVEAVGAGVSNVRPGERIFTAGSLTGTYAQFCLCRQSQVRLLPERLTFAQGAGIHIPYSTAARSLRQKALARPGEVVLVHGATGGVGLAAVQVARAIGCVVIGTGGTEEGRKTVREVGAQHVLDHTIPGYLDSVFALTDGRGADVVLEMLANRNLDEDLRVVAVRGRVVVIGSRGRIEIDPRRLMTRDVTVLGVSILNATSAEVDELYAFVATGLSDGRLAPVVREELPLAQAPQAHERVMAPGAHGKIVLIP